MCDINELIIIIFTHINDNIMYCHSFCQSLKNKLCKAIHHTVQVASFPGLPRGGREGLVHTVCACAGFSQHSRNSVSRSDISALLYVTLVYSRIIFRFRDGMSEF